MNKIEQGEIPLQDSLEQYEKGMALIKHCRGILQKAEKRIEKISKEEPSEQEKRGRRRAAAARIGHLRAEVSTDVDLTSSCRRRP